MKFKLVRAESGTPLPNAVYWFTSRSRADREVASANAGGAQRKYWEDHLLFILSGDIATREYWGIGIDSEPEFNEWGEVSL